MNSMTQEELDDYLTRTRKEQEEIEKREYEPYVKHICEYILEDKTPRRCSVDMFRSKYHSSFYILSSNVFAKAVGMKMRKMYDIIAYFYNDKNDENDVKAVNTAKVILVSFVDCIKKRKEDKTYTYKSIELLYSMVDELKKCVKDKVVPEIISNLRCNDKETVLEKCTKYFSSFYDFMNNYDTLKNLIYIMKNNNCPEE